jgi:hypothetical protein
MFPFITRLRIPSSEPAFASLSVGKEPVVPADKGNPVAFVSTPAVGVPRLVETNVGEFSVAEFKVAEVNVAELIVGEFRVDDAIVADVIVAPFDNTTAPVPVYELALPMLSEVQIKASTLSLSSNLYRLFASQTLASPRESRMTGLVLAEVPVESV